MTASGARVLHFAETDSTNAEAARLAAGGAEAPLWVVAGRQTAGRARRGRTWSPTEGALYASLLTRPGATAEGAALASFAAALAVGDLVATLAPGAGIAFKWPNDVLMEGAKIAGILLESSGRGAAVDWLVIGIGVNLVAAPDAAEIRPGGATPGAIAALGGRRATPGEALAILDAALDRHLDRLAREGFAPIRRDWLARAARLGQTIGAGLATGRLDGVFEDVDLNGAVVLRTPDGARRVIAAADIYFPR
ncbi:MAG: biotin--[acetyl-CoA-carboxylase] ligase [Pseudomonadota bacterium]